MKENIGLQAVIFFSFSEETWMNTGSLWRFKVTNTVFTGITVCQWSPLSSLQDVQHFPHIPVLIFCLTTVSHRALLPCSRAFKTKPTLNSLFPFLLLIVNTRFYPFNAIQSKRCLNQCTNEHCNKTSMDDSEIICMTIFPTLWLMSLGNWHRWHSLITLLPQPAWLC